MLEVYPENHIWSLYLDSAQNPGPRNPGFCRPRKANAMSTYPLRRITTHEPISSHRPCQVAIEGSDRSALRIQRSDPTVTATSVPQELANALELLEDVSQEGDQYRAVCPQHNGHGLTVRWNAASNALLVHCHAGCAKDDVVSALRKMGVHIGSARQRYEYRDANGVLHWTKVRSRAKDTGRRFTYYMCHSRKGVVPIEGIHLSKKTRKPDGTCRFCGSSEHPRGMLYNAEAVATAIANGDEIWLVEGEKDADALSAKGVIATTAMNGVDDWGPIYVDQLHGARSIVIVADNDSHSHGKRGAYSRYLSLTEHAESVCVKMAKTGKDSFDHLHAGYSLKDFVDVSISELEELTQLSNGDGADATDPLPGEEMTNIGYKNRFVELHSADFLHSQRLWRVWSGTHWEEDELQRTLGAATRLARTMTRVYGDVARRSEKDDKSAQALLRRSLEMEGAGNILATLRLAQADLACSEASFDTDAALLVCRSGIYAGGGVFEPHDPLKLYTKCIPFEHDPNATCPEWDEYVDSSIRDEDQWHYLQTLLGFALVGGDRKKKRVVNLIGPKDTGKTTFLRLVGEILEPYVATPAVEELVSGGRRTNTDKFALNELRGSRLAAASETERRSEFRLAALKALTGGDMIQTQGKGTRPVTWRASVMLLLATNDRIKFDATDKAFTDRLVPIEFKRRRKIDRALEAKLESEKPGIFNWILAGVDSYLRDEMVEPKSIRDARTTAETEVTTPYQFLVAAIDRGKLKEVPATYPVMRCCKISELHTLYKSWCKFAGMRPVGQQEFTRIVDTRYPLTEKNAGDGVRHYLGIADARKPRK